MGQWNISGQEGGKSLNNWQDRKEGTTGPECGPSRAAESKPDQPNRARRQGTPDWGLKGAQRSGPRSLPDSERPTKLVIWIVRHVLSHSESMDGHFLPSKHRWSLSSENTEGPHHPENMGNLHIRGELCLVCLSRTLESRPGLPSHRLLDHQVTTM